MERGEEIKQKILGVLENSDGMPVAEISAKVGHNYYMTLKYVDELVHKKVLTKFIFRNTNYYKLGDKNG